MGTTMNKKTYEKMIQENIWEIEKYMPDSLERRHTIDVLRHSINAIYEGEGLLTKPKINLPSEEDIKKEYSYGMRVEASYQQRMDDMRKGAMWVRNFVLAATPK